MRNGEGIRSQYKHEPTNGFRSGSKAIQDHVGFDSRQPVRKILASNLSNQIVDLRLLGCPIL